MNIALEETAQRRIWLWKRADWLSMKKELLSTDWNGFRQDDANQHSSALTTYLIDKQERYVPKRVYFSMPIDQFWFGYRCHLTVEQKYKAWMRYVRIPTLLNLDIHRRACKRMISTSNYAQAPWLADTRRKLTGPRVGSKVWWQAIKKKQDITRQDTIPPLNKPDGTEVSSNCHLAELLGQMFSAKMSLSRTSPHLQTMCMEPLTNIGDNNLMEKLLQEVCTRKATGPDDESSYPLK